MVYYVSALLIIAMGTVHGFSTAPIEAPDSRTGRSGMSWLQYCGNCYDQCGCQGSPRYSANVQFCEAWDCRNCEDNVEVGYRCDLSDCEHCLMSFDNYMFYYFDGHGR